MIAASLAGLAVSLFKLHLWPPLYVGIKMLGDVSIPLLLFSLGVRLLDSSFKDIRLGIVGAVFCPLAGFLIAWVAAPRLGLTGVPAAMLMVFGALPPAVLNYVFAEQYQQEPERVASIVMVGNLTALVFVPLALAFVLR